MVSNAAVPTATLSFSPFLSSPWMKLNKYPPPTFYSCENTHAIPSCKASSDEELAQKNGTYQLPEP